MQGTVAQYRSLRAVRNLAPGILIALLAGCSAGSGDNLDSNGRPLSEGGNTGPIAAEFKSLQDNLFTPICTVCHAGAAAPQGLRLDESASYSLLVGVASSQVPGLLRVDPGNPDNSYLVQKLEGTAQVGAQMPLGGPALAQADIDLVRQWITDGALPATDIPPDLPPVVTSITPQDGAILGDAPTELVAIFSSAMDAALFSASTFALERSGADGTFDDGNEVAIAATAIAVSAGNPRQASFTIDPANPELRSDSYRITLVGTGATALANTTGTVLDGDNDGVAGGDFQSNFSLTTVLPTLQSIQDNVFTPTCATANCHTGPGGPGLPAGQDLSSANASFLSLVDVASQEVPALKRVEPFDADASYLVRKLAGTASVGARMPLGSEPLSVQTLDAIRLWINDGALFDESGGGPDTLPPVISITPPGNPVAGTVVLSSAAVDDVAVAQVRYFLDGELLGSSASAPYSIAWNSQTTADGSHTLHAEAEDAAGNVGLSAAVAITVQNGPPPDTTAPTVTVFSPSNSVSGVVTLTATAADDTAVAQVQFLVDGQPVGIDTTEPYSVQWDTQMQSLGAHIVSAQATDAAGNVGTSAPVAVSVVDAQPPSVSLTSPVASTVSGLVAVSATASDDRGLAEVRFYIDNLLLASVAAPPYETSWDSTTVADGMHTITAEAVDASNNVAISPVKTVTVDNAPPADTLPPMVSLNLPLPGLLSGTVALDAQATDNIGVTEVRFRANGALIAAVAAEPYLADWDTTGVADGDYTVLAEAIDLAGNLASTPGVLVTVDNTLPTLLTQNPPDGAVLDAFPTVLTLTFSEPMEPATLDTVSVSLLASGGDGSFDDGNETPLTPVLISASGATLSVDISGVAPMEDTFQLTIAGSVTDLAGLPLDGNADGTGGDDYTSEFSVDALLPTLTSIQKHVFDTSCAFSGCHNGPMGPGLPSGQDLSSVNGSFASLVGVTSLEVPGLLRVDPGNPDDSYLIRKLEGTQSVGNQMPLGGAPLSQADIDVVRQWITSGAQQ